MIISTTKFLQVEDRIDAEYYKSEYSEVFSILEKCKKQIKTKTLENLSQIITKGETPLWRGDVYVREGIPFLRVVNFVGEDLDLSNVVFIPEFVHERMKRSQIKPGDVLLSMAGRIGTAVIVPDELKIANINQAIAKIRLREKINKYYLIIFLNSRFGRLQSLRKASGGVQNNINFEDIKSIEVPILSQSFQQKIEKMVKEAQKKRKLADEKYKEAEEILNKKLGLDDLDLSTQKAFKAKFSEAEDRFDPEYYQPKYKKVQNLIMKSKFKKKSLESFVKKYNCGFTFPTEIYLEKGVSLLRIKNLKKMEIDFEGIKLLPDLNEYQEFVAKPGDILISMSGTVGLASLVPENIPKAFVNQRITSISIEGIDKLYLCLYLNLSAINSLMIKETTGGVQKNITYQDIISILIPILPQSTQQKISSLIQGSFKLRKDAKELIKKAKIKLEKMIES